MAEVGTKTWRDQVLEEHQELRTTFAGLDSFLEGDRPEVGEEGFHTWAAELSKMLVKLHDRLFRHFRFEEEGCKVEKICQEHPEAAGKIDELMAQHPQLLSSIRDLMSASLRYSVGELPRDPALRTRVKALLEALGKHEREETHLIQRLEYRDFGVGD